MKKKFNTHKLTFIILFLYFPAFSCLGTNYNAEFDDWIVSSTCKDRTAKLCHGYYLEPVYPYPLNDKTEYPTQITSDRGEFVNKGTSTFYGNVVIQQGNDQLKTDKATITHNEETGELEVMHAEGNVTITEPNLRIDGSRATVYQQEDRKIVDNTTYRMYPRHARGTSDSITVLKRTQMFLPNASYTTCAPSNNTWFIRAKKTKFNKESGRGEAWHSWLYIKNFKVFYWPYINFPIDNRRQTGFLMPTMGAKSSDGPSVSAPFYWNLAPNYDAIITPNYMVKRGAKFDSHFRYLTHHSMGSIKFNFLPDDKGYQSFRNKKLEQPGNVFRNDIRTLGLRDLHHRYSLAINDKTTFNKQFKSEIDYTKIGDDNYIMDFDGDILQQNFSWQTANPIQAGTTYLAQPSVTNLMQPGTTTPNYAATTAFRQKIEFQYLSSLGTTTSKLEQYQILHPFNGPEANETYRSLPALNFQSSVFDLPYDFNWNVLGNYTNFKVRKVPFNAPLSNGNTYYAPLSTGERYYFQPSLAHDFGTPGWFIRPKAQLNTVTYRDIKLNPADLASHKVTQATRSIPIYNIESGLVFDSDRTLNISNHSFSQTLEPKVYYLYAPHHEQRNLPAFDSAPLGTDYYQAFRNNRYSGFDRVGEANQLGMGIMNRFLAAETGEEKASIGVSRILYFQDRIPHLGEQIDNSTRWSPIAAIAKYQIRQYWNIEGNLVKEKLNKTTAGSLTLQYLTDPTHVVNFGYQFIRNDAFNTDIKRPSHTRTVLVSSAWELIPELRLLGRLGHDLNLSRVTNVLFGIEKHNCCTIFRVVWIRNIKPTNNIAIKQYDNVLSLQFVLKGLAQTGSINTNELNSMIPGYYSKDNEF